MLNTHHIIYRNGRGNLGILFIWELFELFFFKANFAKNNMVAHTPEIQLKKLGFLMKKKIQKTLIQSDTKPIKCKLIGWTHFATIKKYKKTTKKNLENFET